ncbi:MAG: hypothetical protein GY953_32890, partial [bacterium]|nr:hypothetical protein [bacterium]
MTPARRVAFDVLGLVEGGGYASDLLRARTENLKSRDAALAGEVVFGVLRYQAQLDHLIEHFSGRPAAKLDREVRLALRAGIYQLRYLTRIPRHAAVGESVEMVRRARKRSATGLVNAVLRKVDRRAVEWPSRAVACSQPDWLLKRWEQRFGEQAAGAITAAFLEKPAVYIRVPDHRLKEAAPLRASETEVPGCYRIDGRNTGSFRRQDISSQSIIGLLDLRPGERFLDLCAAPGNKTAQALETGVRAVACDVNRLRLRALDNLPARRVVLDATHTLPFSGRFDKIMVDSPCSGTGTIGRNPEIKWRVQPEDFSRHHARQVALLVNASAALAAGGRPVYSTCSLEAEENAH